MKINKFALFLLTGLTFFCAQMQASYQNVYINDEDYENNPRLTLAPAIKTKTTKPEILDSFQLYSQFMSKLGAAKDVPAKEKIIQGFIDLTKNSPQLTIEQQQEQLKTLIRGIDNEINFGNKFIFYNPFTWFRQDNQEYIDMLQKKRSEINTIISNLQWQNSIFANKTAMTAAKAGALTLLILFSMKLAQNYGAVGLNKLLEIDPNHADAFKQYGMIEIPYNMLKALIALGMHGIHAVTPEKIPAQEVVKVAQQVVQ